jgi:hypothetical protein
MQGQILTLEELKDISFEEIIRQLLSQQNSLTVLVSDDEEVSIQLRSRLKPLPVLDGSIPAGWKEAIYG